MKQMKRNLMRTALLFSFFTISLFIFGCSDQSSPSSGQGQIMVTMVDSPADFEHVNIVVTRVEVHKAGADSTSGWTVINNNSATYDLLTLRNGASAVLGNTTLDAGHYTQIRLIVGTGSTVVVNGMSFNLNVPSTGIKLNHEFDIMDGTLYALTLDFNVDHSIHQTGNGQYMLVPTIRLVPVVTSGTISGNVAPISAASSVFAISGTDTVSTIADASTGAFKLMALLQGTYTVKVVSKNVLYNDKTIANVSVTAKQNTDLGTINLTLK
ncbi:MAG: DUF4382 domain-containing protein [Melioribacteraceae bacterium]